MAYNANRRAGLGALISAMFAAVQWRLLLLWLLFLLLPTAIVALPLSQMLGGLLDNSVHASEWAQQFNALMFTDVMMQLYDHTGWLTGTALLGLLLTLLLSPFLTGMVIGSGRAGRPLGFGGLLQNGWIEYGRMFRLLLWALVPYLIVIGIFAMGSKAVDSHAEHALLQSQADTAGSMLHWLVWIVFVLAQAIVESARAAFIADVNLRSATRALGRGIMQLLRRPLATLLFYLAVSLVGLILAGLFGIARIHTTAFGIGGFLLALLLTQLIVVAVGWMRTARLFALAEVARSMVPGNRRTSAL